MPTLDELCAQLGLYDAIQIGNSKYWKAVDKRGMGDPWIIEYEPQYNHYNVYKWHSGK